MRFIRSIRFAIEFDPKRFLRLDHTKPTRRGEISKDHRYYLRCIRYNRVADLIKHLEAYVAAYPADFMHVIDMALGFGVFEQVLPLIGASLSRADEKPCSRFSLWRRTRVAELRFRLGTVVLERFDRPTDDDDPSRHHLAARTTLDVDRHASEMNLSKRQFLVDVQKESRVVRQDPSLNARPSPPASFPHLAGISVVYFTWNNVVDKTGRRLSRDPSSATKGGAIASEVGNV
jgi:hypothetical protein